MIEVAVCAALAWLATCVVVLRLGLAWLEERRAARATTAELDALRAAIAAETTARVALAEELHTRVREAERAAGTRPRIRA